MFKVHSDTKRRHVSVWLPTLLCLVMFGAAMTSSRTSRAQETLAMESWQVTCQADDDCVAYYRTAGLEIYIGKASGTQTVVAEFRLLAESAAGAPVTLRVDNGWVGAMRVETCDELSCRLAVDIANAPELIEQFRLARDGVIAYVADGKIVMIPFLLNGFTNAVSQAGV
jgi:invasion protein IalB